ncbi:hypothetical protein D3C73_1044200 [compost metagenome]
MYTGNRQGQILIHFAGIAKGKTGCDIGNQLFVAELFDRAAPNRNTLVGHCREDHYIGIPGGIPLFDKDAFIQSLHRAAVLGFINQQMRIVVA